MEKLNFEGNSLFSYENVMEVMNESYYDKEQFILNLAEFGTKHLEIDTENENDMNRLDAHVQDIVNRIENGKFMACYEIPKEFFIHNEDYRKAVLAAISLEELTKEILKKDFGFEYGSNDFQVYAPVAIKFMNKHENPVVDIKQVCVMDFNNEAMFTLPKESIKAPLSNLDIAEISTARVVSDFDFSESNKMQDGKATEIDISKIEFQIGTIENMINSAKDVEKFFLRNEIYSKFLPVDLGYKSNEVFLTDTKNLPDYQVHVSITTDSPTAAYDMLNNAKKIISELETANSKDSIVAKFAKKLSECYKDETVSVTCFGQNNEEISLSEYEVKYAKETKQKNQGISR